ncbi:MAG: NFACT family protein [Candidatus Zixiibacteriota bacterium]|nr:MAG: NFACT family protein [candidate division Zixibacteria bacterium]
MELQKLTVLDTARVREELKRFKNHEIEGAFSGFSGRRLYLKFRESSQILVYSVGTASSYIGITNELPDKLEKSLGGIDGYYFTDVRQSNYDRILSVELEKKDRLGKMLAALLILEMIPNIGDVYIVDKDFNIKSSLRKKRKKIYKYPGPLKKPTILNIDKDRLEKIHDADLDPFKEIYGLNKRDILNFSLSPEADNDELLHDLTEYVLQARKPGPAWIIARGDEYIGYSLVKPILTRDETAIEIESALAMYEQYYSEVAGRIDEKKRIENLQRMCKSEISRRRKKISRIKKELEESRKADLYKMYGEMILSNIGRIKKGADSIDLDPLYNETGDKITIKLDPSKSPSANAESYFKKSRKAAGSKMTLGNRLRETETELADLTDIADSFEQKPNLMERKLIEMGLLTSDKSETATRKAAERRKPYRVYRATCGWEILIGKSNKDNDELTFHIASKEDFWFHAWQAAGSHTVLRLPDKSSKPDKQTLLEAASLAAYHSKARNSSKVPVAYTQVKYVRKPRKFPPGKVLVEREKQLMVKPANPDDFLPTR